ncbi:MAG: DOMON-like domain-containing protein [Deltaproteobacteria bacterium]|nr:DOMON-like domain-containing protein [Deltaproteobacteria bacterium]
MSSRRFALQPFPEAGSAPSLKIEGEISRVSNRLAIRYELLGHLSEIMIPLPADLPARKNALWEETCFEFFMAAKDSSPYWEFNLSPAGHWNVFRFAAYREGMQEDMAFEALSFDVQRHSSALSLSLEIDPERIIQPGQVLEIGISAVITCKSGETSYWALAHLGQQADFHRRDSFVIKLQR